MEISGDDVADAALKVFDSWPAKRKPLDRGNGAREWVPMSGIVAEVGGKLTCLSTATGMKCLPQNKISQAQGVTLHDWHAEVLVVRAFDRFLLDECHSLASSQKVSSEYVRLRSPDERSESNFQPFTVRNEIKFHMYCSEAPCGDASMELTMASQEDSTPWDLPPPTATNSSTDLLQGRSYFSNLGTIRRKPSRPDAPPTLSKSCSDKLALKQGTSLLSSITSLLISPENVYIASLVLHESQYSGIACNRAFGKNGRLAAIDGAEWEGDYRFFPFRIKTTSKEFPYSRRQVLKEGETLVPSNLASFSTPMDNGTLIGGSLQGRKQFSLSGASLMSKKMMWAFVLDIASLLSEEDIADVLGMETYLAVKQSYLLDQRRAVKSDVRRVLGGDAGEAGWVRNQGDEDFDIDIDA